MIEQTDAGESWQWRYRGRTIVSVMSKGNAAHQTLEVRFGIFSFRMKISGPPYGLDMEIVSARAGRLSLSGFLTPGIVATERVDDLGRHLFDVAISLPVIGRFVRAIRAGSRSCNLHDGLFLQCRHRPKPGLSCP